MSDDAAPPPSRASSSQGAVLVVDDDDDTRGALATVLRDDNYDVATAADGSAAIAAVCQRAFDVVVTDVKMRGADGLAVLRATKSAAPDTEVIVTTAFASVDLAVACLRAGAADLVQKPLQLEAVLAAVARATGRRRLYTASQALLEPGDPADLPRVVVESAMAVLRADDASLMLPGADGELHVAHSHGLPPEFAASVRVALGARVAGRVAQDRTPLLLAGALDADVRFAGVAGHGRAESSIVYPLVAGARLVGVLSVSRRVRGRPFVTADVRQAAVVASQALLALERARLLRERLALERLASMGQFAAAISHEINNPLTYVLASLEAARASLGAAAAASGPASDVAQAIADAHAGAARIREIVRDVAALARSDAAAAGGIVDVNDALRSALRIASAEVAGRAEVELQLGADVAVVGDAGPLAQVFTNLLVNAAHAVAEQPPPGGAPPRIVVRSRRAGAQVVIEVEDNGPGIQPEHAAKLFEPFFTTRRRTQGTGLGLAISREIVRRHGGELRVESTPGAGATFVVALPAAAPGNATTAPASDVADTREAHARGRILVVDDEPAILRMFERLWARDHDLVLANGGAEALAAIAARPDLDLIVCDVLMPDVNGMEVYRQATAAHPALADAFVFMTGCPGQDTVREFARRVPNPVLEKPLTLDHLRAILREHVTRRTSGKLP